MHQMLSSLWSSGCRGETDCLMMAFQEKFQGFLHAIPETTMLLQKENRIWLTVIMIWGAILQNRLRDGCLEKGVSDVKHSGLLCLKGKEGKRKAARSRSWCQQRCLRQLLPTPLLMGTRDIRKKHRGKERGRTS